MAKPWQSYEEYLTDQALTAAVSDPETIRSIRPAHPLETFPQTRGLVKQEPNVLDILDINRYAASNRTHLSGFPVRRTSLIDDSWSGAGRYSMEALG
jgi:hypothetical protein